MHFHHFTTDNGQVVSPPSPEILAIHATCAQVAHLSGVAEMLKELYQGEDDGLCALSHSPHDMSVNPADFGALERVLRMLQVSGA